MDLQLHDPAFLAVASGGTPALDLFFSATKAIDSRITFTRGSTGTFINSSGLVESAASGVARFTHDPVTLASLGLLVEESRTNLFQRSEEFNDAYWNKGNASVSANATTAPDGATTADKLVEDTATATHQLFRTISVTSGQAYTFSLFIKPAGRSRIQFNLPFNFPASTQAVFDASTGTVVSSTGGATASISAQANGFYRCVVTATATATSNGTLYLALVNTGTTTSYTGDGSSGLFLWGAQVEAGAFATSYIPTTSATVTRSADVATMSGTNFSSWYNQSEGTFLAEFNLISTLAGNRPLAVANNGTTNERVYGYISTIGAPSLLVTSSSINQASLANSAVSAGVISETAFAYKSDDFALCTNGGAVALDTSGVIASSNRLDIGYFGASGVYLNGQILRIRYYRRRLPDANLQTLTT